MPEYESEQAAIQELAREFPDVPARIINEVVDAYLRRSPTVTQAATAARHRILDACAL